MNSIQKSKIGIMLFIISTFPLASQTVIDNLEIQKSEKQTLSAGTIVNNLIIHADKYTCGQLQIQSGIVQVKNMTYKYTITPSEWSPISFPSDITDITSPTASNLAVLGLIFNNTSASNPKKTLIRSYNSSNRSNGSDPWVNLSTPSLKANVGYFIAVVTGNTTPTDLEFYFTNMSLDNTKSINQLLIDVDMDGKVANSDYPVSLAANEVSSNTLNVTVHNDPQSGGGGIDHQKALEVAQIYFTEDKKGFRISLPNSEHCKVLIMDKKLKKVFKAIDYVSPGVIPVSELKKKTYQIYLQYGNGSEVKELVLN